MTVHQYLYSSYTEQHCRLV